MSKDLDPESQRFFIMNYQKIYNQLIEKARNSKRVRSKEQYYEAHHIIPKCTGGLGATWQWNSHPNIVLLTAREHFIAHQLLYRIYPDNIKIKHALWSFYKFRNKTHKRDYKISARSYEILKKERSAYLSTKMRSFRHSEETKAKMSRARKGTQLGKVVTDETRAKLVEAAKLKPPFTEQHKKNISLALKGRPVNKDAAAIQKNKDSVSKPILQYSKEGEFIRQWPSAQEAAKHIKIHYSVISHNLCGRAKSAGGFVWKFKN